METHDNIHYSQCWEDADLVVGVLNIEPSDTVISVTSGGCNTLSIASCEPKIIYSVDFNNAQTCLGRLKHLAAAKLGYNKYLEFIGVYESSNRNAMYRDIEKILDPDCRAFFQKKQQLLEKGLIHSGKFENYLNLFRKYILPVAQSSKTISQLLNAQDNDHQAKIYFDKWNNRRWQFLGRIFFSRTVMQRMGRHKKMFRYNSYKEVGQTILKRVEIALSEGIVYKNPYLEYILKGNYKNSLPHYLRKDVFNKWRLYKDLHFVNQPVLKWLKSTPDNSISKFCLSDIFESMNETETAEVFEQVVRTATDGARLLFWNNMVQRDVPEHLKDSFKFENDLENEYHAREKVFFYERFFIYSISK